MAPAMTPAIRSNGASIKHYQTIVLTVDQVLVFSDSPDFGGRCTCVSRTEFVAFVATGPTTWLYAIANRHKDGAP